MTMIYRLFPLVFFVLLFESCTAQNETSSQNQFFLSDAYGVTSHITRKGERWNYATKRRELQMMSEIGVNCCRFNFDAYNITSSGKGGMSSPIFDEVCQELKKTGMEFLPILSDYSNGKYAWQGEWYEKYVTYLSSKYGKEATYWEVMNEIDHPNNIKHFIHGCSDYVNVLKKTNDIIKKSNPTAKILCSSLCDLKYTFLDSLSRLGAYEYFDIVNLHSYAEPEVLPIQIKSLKEHMSKYGWSKPIWITESGMSTVLKTENSTNKLFFTDFLPTAMMKISLTPKNTIVSVLKDDAVGYSSMNDDEVDEWLKPICKDVKFMSFDDVDKTTISLCPILVVSQTSDFPMKYFDIIVSYVNKGGTIVLAGGTPLYYDIQIDSNNDVKKKQVNDTYYSKLHMSAMFWWLDKAKKKNVPKVPTYAKNLFGNYQWTFSDTYSSRFMCGDQLRGKDSLITMIEAGNEKFKGCVAGIYKLNSDLKGNVIFQTREGISNYYKEDSEQARRLPRIFILSYAYGVEKVFWYNFRSAEISDTDKESHFGLVHKNLSPKKAFKSYQTLIRMLPNGSTCPNLQVKGNLYMASWSKPDKTKVWALWRKKGRKNEYINVGNTTDVYDLYGGKLKVANTIEISENVIYFVGQNNNPIFGR